MCMTHTKWRREREKAAVWTPAYDWKEGFWAWLFFGCGGDGFECWCTEGKRYRRMMATTEMWILLDAFNIRHIQHCSTSTHSHTPVIIYIRVESNGSVSHTVRIALIVERYLCFVRNKFLFISAICSNEHNFSVASSARMVWCDCHFKRLTNDRYISHDRFLHMHTRSDTFSFVQQRPLTTCPIFFSFLRCSLVVPQHLIVVAVAAALCYYSYSFSLSLLIL